MKITRPLSALIALALLSAPAVARSPYLEAPAGDRFARFDPSGLTIIPDGRLLRPYGRSFPMSRWPTGLAITDDGRKLFVASESRGQIVDGWEKPSPAIAPLESKGSDNGGIAITKDGRTLYWSDGEGGGVFVYDLKSGKRIATISLNVKIGGKTYDDSFVMDAKLSPDDRYLYCADVANFRVVIIDAKARKPISSVGVGRYPYALAVMGSRVYVANIGMFEYSAIPKPKEGSGFDPRGLTFPPYAFPSEESKKGVRDLEGRDVPGLGDPNVLESFSVWGIDAQDPARPRIIRRIKTGLLVGAHADRGNATGGSGPNYLATDGKRLYVSDGNNDLVERIDPATGKVVQRISLNPSPLVRPLRGVGPAGMALYGNRLYVAESGINALAVLDTTSGKVLGHIPTAWYPYRVVVSKDGKKLACICFKGFGNGPNGGANVPKSPFRGMAGVLSVMSVPPMSTLKALTARTLENDGITDRSGDPIVQASKVIPHQPGVVSPQIKYVVFIAKENHTFDTIFDRVPGSENDPSLLRWGYHQKISGPNQPTLDDAPVMVNHNELARQFTVSDNFYMEPEASGVGHRWLIGIEPNNFCQMTYTLGWDFKAKTTAPGRRASFGSNGSMIPEDYPEAGAVWEHLWRNGIGFRNYGEGFEFPGVGEDEDEEKTGAREVVNIPMPKPLYDNTCREFPIFNMNIPDQYRADWFIKDFSARYVYGHEKMPSFLNIALCSDHGTSPHPDHGYPYVASWMADNDLAMGRIVDFLTHSPYWKNMAIFVTEDDSGGEPDHIDAQRSVMLVISPWVKHHNVSRRHTTIVSMHRTLYEILGLPSLNMFDGLASDFSDCFTTTPDFAPYKYRSVDPRVFDPKKAIDPKDPDYKRARLEPGIPMDDPVMMEDILHQAEKSSVPDHDDD